MSSNISFFFDMFKICGKLMSVRAWGPCTCYDCQWSWILEGFTNLSFSMLLIFFSYASSMHWNEIMHPGDFLFHTFKTIDELNDRYLENCNECFIISTFGLWAVVLLFSLGLKINFCWTRLNAWGFYAYLKSLPHLLQHTIA